MASLTRPAQRGHEDRVFAGGVRREEFHDVAVIEREPGRAESLRVGGEVGAAAGQSRREIREAIAPIAERARERVESREPVEDSRRVAGGCSNRYADRFRNSPVASVSSA